jgi:hypothetical protein
MKTKTYALTLRHDSGTVEIRIAASSLASAKQRVLDAERAPESAIQSWRIVPTARQIRRTQNLMRCI